MGSWIHPGTYTGVPEPEWDSSILINGFEFHQPCYFKNKAQARGFHLALLLASTRPMWSGVILIDTTQCIDHIMFAVPEPIRLNINAVNPNKIAHDAMRYVPEFFEAGKVKLDTKTKGRRPWYLELLQ